MHLDKMYTLVLECEPAVEALYKSLQVNLENAGIDLYAADDASVQSAQELQYISLGVKAVLLSNDKPVHYWLLPRSSFAKTGFIMANSVGVIDKSYRGTLKAPVRYLQYGTGIQKLNRYFQIVAPDMGPITSIQFVQDITVYDSKRGADGFGSTGTL
jgi:dUTP pyrophosphatase